MVPAHGDKTKSEFLLYKTRSILLNSPAQYTNLQLTMRRQRGPYYAAHSAGAPAGEPGSRNAGDERKSDILPRQLPWLCVGIMAL